MKTKAEVRAEKKTEKAASIKAMKTTTEVENFYRFIFDNGMRDEAHQLMKVALKAVSPRGRRKSRKLQ